MEVWPAAQLVQAPPLDEILPAAQSAQAVKGLLELLPAAQSAQAPPLYEVLPASQSTQAVNASLEVFPAAQLPQAPPPPIDALPSVQLAQI